MARKIRSDIRIGNLEKKLGLEEGAIRNPDGSNARSDKKLGTLQGEYQRLFAGPPVRTNNKSTVKPTSKATKTPATKSATLPVKVTKASSTKPATSPVAKKTKKK